MNTRFILTFLFTLLAVVIAVSADDHPPIPVQFTLKEPGFVTLVIDDSTGHRVRNLIGDTFFTAGNHTVYWDGLDESGIVHGVQRQVYSVQGKLVNTGSYNVRGIVHQQLNLVYEMTVNNPGNPPWETEKGDGAWLADHSPQTSVLALPKGSPYGKMPQMLLASSVAEAGFSLAWVDLNGNKIYGSKLSGWQGGHALAADTGKLPVENSYAYSLYYDNGKVQLWSLNNDGKCSNLISYTPTKPYTRADTYHMSLAIYNGFAIISLPPENKLLIVDATGKQGRVVSSIDLNAPAGLLVDTAGTLYAVTDKEVHSFSVDWKAGVLNDEKTFISAATGMQDIHKLTLDDEGNLYVSDWGNSMQVKVFSQKGALLRAIGTAGPLQVGIYNPLIMTQPNGVAISPDKKLWVSESSYLPKRCSVWSLDGKLLNSFIGPTPYGGGGILDPVDKSRFYFAPASGSLEFNIDWKKGTSELAAVLFRPDTGRLQILNKDGVNQTPHYAIWANKQRYMTNAYNENDGPTTTGIWIVKNGTARLVAAAGVIRSWTELDDIVVSSGYVKTHLPEGVDITEIKIADKKIPLFNQLGPDGKRQRVNLGFVWSDINNDEKIQPEEVTFAPVGHPYHSWIAGKDLSLVSNYGDKLEVQKFTEDGVPVYDASKIVRMLKTPVAVSDMPVRQQVVGKDDWFVLTGGPIEGYHNGEKVWQYHSQWASGHSKGLSPKPQYSGQLLNTMTLLGPTVSPRGTDTEIWGMVGDYGNLFLLTTDGFFVSTLFKDTRVAASHYWPTPAKRGMILNDCTLLGECYFPTMVQTADGNVYLQAGKNRSSIVRVDGLDSIRRLPPIELNINKEMLIEAKNYFLRQEQNRTKISNDDNMTIAICPDAPTIDGKLDEWKKAQWVTVDPLTKAAMVVADDNLFAAFTTTYPLTLDNRPDSAQTIFKGGDALDIMLGINPAADLKRQKPVAGDIRLTVAMVKGKTLAVLFHAVDLQSKNPVKYESPIGSATIDSVEDISEQVELAGRIRTDQKTGNKYAEWELSVPMTALGLDVKDGQTILGDIGILRGNPGLSGERLYWHNKAAGQTADLPTEALLTPELWGRLTFKDTTADK